MIKANPYKHIKKGICKQLFVVCISDDEPEVCQLTDEEKEEDYSQLVHSVSQDVLHHCAGNERLFSAVWSSEQQGFGWRLRGKGQRSEGVHDEVDPQHLHSFQRRVLEICRPLQLVPEGENEDNYSRVSINRVSGVLVHNLLCWYTNPDTSK